MPKRGYTCTVTSFSCNLPIEITSYEQGPTNDSTDCKCINLQENHCTGPTAKHFRAPSDIYILHKAPLCYHNPRLCQWKNRFCRHYWVYICTRQTCNARFAVVKHAPEKKIYTFPAGKEQTFPVEGYIVDFETCEKLGISAKGQYYPLIIQIVQLSFIAARLTTGGIGFSGTSRSTGVISHNLCWICEKRRRKIWCECSKAKNYFGQSYIRNPRSVWNWESRGCRRMRSLPCF